MDEEFEPAQDGEPTETEAEPSADQKLRKENESLRRRLRTFEAAEKYGKDYAELIPESMPISEWDGWIEKLRAKFPAAAPATAAESAPPVAPVEPTEDEKRLAAVNATGQGAPVPTGIFSAEEAIRLYAENPAQYQAMKAAGAIRLEKLPGSTKE